MLSTLLTCPGVGETDGIFPGTAINEDSSDVDIAFVLPLQWSKNFLSIHFLGCPCNKDTHMHERQFMRLNILKVSPKQSRCKLFAYWIILHAFL